MKKYPLPLSIPKGQRPIVTQPYGDKSTVDWYRANGLNLTEHNGVDIVLSGGRSATYGAKIVNPFPESFLVKTWWDNPMSTKGNGIMVGYMEDGKRYEMLAWHCSEIKPKLNYKTGETIGFIGNSGLVRPAPSNACVFCGSHIHLMLYVDKVLTDPLTVFDVKRWFIGPKTSIKKDLPPFTYYLNRIKNRLADLLGA